MKKGWLKILTAVALLAAVVPCAVSPVFANSGKRYEYGVTAWGSFVLNEESELAVESEKLTFDIKSFPDYPDISGYNSTVTAEYKFVNTSENTVTTSMAFPISTDPECKGDVMPPKITVGGEEVAVEIRHTYGRYATFDQVKEICDGYFEDAFYTPETKVTEITVQADVGANDDLRLTGKVTCGDGARFMVANSSETEITYYMGGENNEYSFYVFGNADEFSCEWSCEEYVRRKYSSGGYRPCTRTVSMVKSCETTLKQFALEYRKADSAVSETDWYNAVVMRFGDKKNAGYVYRDFEESNFTKWYLYDVTLAAGERVVNTVCSSIFPSRNYGYSPNVYEYEYYLSPAAGWKSFGKLEIVINTDYYLTASSTSFDKTDGGFKAERDGLPQGELTFSLCTVQEPKRELGTFGKAITVILLIILFAVEIVCVGLITFAIIYLVKSGKKEELKN